MPSLKRDVSTAKDSGFQPYEGPTPRAGAYRGKITACRVRKAGTGRLGFGVTVQLEARPGSEAAKYDGFPAFANIWFGDEEALQTREKQFYIAVAGKATVNVVHDDIDDGGKVKTIEKINPIGRVVLVQLKNGTDEGGDPRVEADAIFKAKDITEDTGPAPEVDDEDDEADLVEDAEEGDEDEEVEVPSAEELDAMTLKDLRAEAKAWEITATKKADILAAFEELRAEVGEEDEDEADDEEEDEDLEDAEDEEEDDEGAEEALREELADLDRAALKARLKEANEEFRVLKRHTDEDLLEAIVSAELGGDEPPF